MASSTPKAVQFSHAAVREAAQAFTWYLARSDAAAQNFATQLQKSLNEVGERPTSFPVYLAGTRRALLNKYPYLIVFRETQDQIQIIAIAHGHRKPGYWIRRLPKP